MKNYDIKAQLFTLAILGSLVAIVGTYVIYAILFPVYWTERLPISNASGQTLTMTEYRYASNVSFAELVTFLANDTTYLADYDYPNYTCGDYAARLHDDAEAHGIRSGIVGVSFEPSGAGNINNSSDLSITHEGNNASVLGHGFNVFNTTDRGLVYVDATGITRQAKALGSRPYVMVVYVEQGKPLGEIAIGQATSPDYAYYQGQESQFNAYRQNVSEFLSEAKAYSQKTDTFNATYEVYQNDRSAFDREYDNFSDELYRMRNSSAIDLELSISLEAQRKSMLDQLDALNSRLDVLQNQSKLLNDEQRSLVEKRNALEQDATGKMIITQWGVVDRVVVCW